MAAKMVQQQHQSGSLSPPPSVSLSGTRFVVDTQQSHRAGTPPTSGNAVNKRDADAVISSALNSARVQEQYSFDGFHFVAVRDHILPSQCRHENGGSNGDAPGGIMAGCQVCEYTSTLRLPQLPEMIFPNNSLTVTYRADPTKSIVFDALDALRMVNADSLPDVKVGPSAIWQQARSDVEFMKNTLKPFDWTFSSDYAGTIHGFQVEATDERIDMEKLKRREPIHFYSQITLFEDELADHGCAQRFYLRVDGVLVRIIDTRIFGEKGVPYLLREWTRREEKIADIPMQEHENLLDPNAIWHLLPIVAAHYSKLLFADQALP